MALKKSRVYEMTGMEAIDLVAATMAMLLAAAFTHHLILTILAGFGVGYYGAYCRSEGIKMGVHMEQIIKGINDEKNND